MAKSLLDVLRCPKCLRSLVYFVDGSDEGKAPFLFCESSKLCFRIEDGIPIMLVEDAESVDELTYQSLVRQAKRYKSTQNIDS